METFLKEIESFQNLMDMKEIDLTSQFLIRTGQIKERNCQKTTQQKMNLQL